jgi:hypothetical protein
MPKPILTDAQPHDEAETLLPWYAIGGILNPAPVASVSWPSSAA